MFEWFAANAATIIVGVILLAVIIAAARSVYKKAKRGNCPGCAAGCPASSTCSAKK